MEEKICEKCSMRVVDHVNDTATIKTIYYKCKIGNDIKKGTCSKCIPWSDIL